MTTNINTDLDVELRHYIAARENLIAAKQAYKDIYSTVYKSQDRIISAMIDNKITHLETSKGTLYLTLARSSSWKD